MAACIYLVTLGTEFSDVAAPFAIHKSLAVLKHFSLGLIMNFASVALFPHKTHSCQYSWQINVLQYQLVRCCDSASWIWRLLREIKRLIPVMCQSESVLRCFQLAIKCTTRVLQMSAVCRSVAVAMYTRKGPYIFQGCIYIHCGAIKRHPLYFWITQSKINRL